MGNFEKLRKGVKRVAWGYFFLYFELKLGTVSVTPAFVGYLLMLGAIGLMKEEVRDLGLLSAMGRVLAAWHGFQWVASLFGQSLDGLWQFGDILISLVNIYFHFQLLTGMAVIARRYQPEGDHTDARLLRYRTVQTVILTGVQIILWLCPRDRALWAAVSVGLVLIYVIVGICLMCALFGLSGCLGRREG